MAPGGAKLGWRLAAGLRKSLELVPDPGYAFRVAFQAPFEIAQSQLQRLRISSVEGREVAGWIFPFFDLRGATRFLVIATPGRVEGGGGAWAVEEFPPEIRLRKAIYTRPIVKYRPLVELEAESIAGTYHFDPRRILAAQPSIPADFGSALSEGNLAGRLRGREAVRDLFFTLDLRRVTGGVSRSGLFNRRRLELAGLRSFVQDSRHCAGPAGKS